MLLIAPADRPEFDVGELGREFELELEFELERRSSSRRNSPTRSKVTLSVLDFGFSRFCAERSEAMLD